MKLSALIIIVFALFLTGESGWGQVNKPGPKKARAPEDYKPRTFKELDEIVSDADLGDKQERLMVHGNILPSRVRATFVGSPRPLPELKTEVIRQWARLYAGNPEHYTKPYHNEMLFEEAGTNHWIAIPERLLSKLTEGLKQGDIVDLFLIRLGKARQGAEWQSVLLLESFEKF